MSAQAYKRLNKEYRQIQANPPPFIIARPSEANILDWHYVITGPPGTPYEGGQYHGRITFPSEYPFKPPRIKMCTPSGRFEINQRLCLSMSDFHEESWNPSWSVSTIITGLLSFMTGNEGTTGSIVTSLSTKKQLAKKSKTFNTYSNPAFKEVFPDIYEQNLKDLSDEKANEIKEKSALQATNNNQTTKELPTTIDKIEDPEDRIRAQSMKTVEIEDKGKSTTKELEKSSTNDHSKNSSTIIVITIAVIFGILLKSMGLW